MDELVFRDLPPPPGGLVRLRVRIGRRRSRMGWGVVVVAILLAAWLWRPRPPPLPVDAGLIAVFGSSPAGLVSLDPEHLALQPVADAPGVRMYRVGGYVAAAR